uniref:Cyclic nucleotide-binding domain-containing protein n=1 Tax=Haptolina ericina TaxID=156174 RepID=A0A7S3BQJ6_9EUKA
MTYIIRTIENDTSGKGPNGLGPNGLGPNGQGRSLHDGVDGQISAAEMEEFEERRRKNLPHKLSGEFNEKLLHAMLEAEAGVRLRLQEAVSRVEIFEALTVQQLAVLCDAMVETRYEPGEYVFEQGDTGDSFYVITEGSAHVIRTEHEGSKDEQQTTLTTLRDGDYFGERALLTDLVRYADVQAVANLRTMSIRRSRFEEVLGPMADIIPETSYD